MAVVHLSVEEFNYKIVIEWLDIQVLKQRSPENLVSLSRGIARHFRRKTTVRDNTEKVEERSSLNMQSNLLNSRKLNTSTVFCKDNLTKCLVLLPEKPVSLVKPSFSFLKPDWTTPCTDWVSPQL